MTMIQRAYTTEIGQAWPAVDADKSFVWRLIDRSPCIKYSCGVNPVPGSRTLCIGDLTIVGSCVPVRDFVVGLDQFGGRDLDRSPVCTSICSFEHPEGTLLNEPVITRQFAIPNYMTGRLLK